MRLFLLRTARGLLLGVAVIFFLYASAMTWARATRSVGIDFYHFWSVPAALRGGASVIYSQPGRESLRTSADEVAAAVRSQRLASARQYWVEPKPTGSPFLYAVFSVLNGADYDADYRRFQAESSMLAALALLLLGWMLVVPLGASLMFAGAAMIGFLPLQADVTLANVSRLMLFPLVLYAALRVAADRWPDRWALSVCSGFVLAASILFKPIFVFAVLTIGLNRLIRRQYRDLRAELAGATLALAVAMLATLALFGTIGAWQDWIENVPSMIASYPLDIGNLTPTVHLQRFIGNAAVPACLVAAGMTLCAQALILRAPHGGARLPSGRADLLALGLALMLYIWISHLVWAHYYTLALPWIMVALTDGWRRRAPLLAGVAVAAVAALLFGTALIATLAVVPLTAALLMSLVPSARDPERLAASAA